MITQLPLTPTYTIYKKSMYFFNSKNNDFNLLVFENKLQRFYVKIIKIKDAFNR